MPVYTFIESASSPGPDTREFICPENPGAWIRVKVAKTGKSLSGGSPATNVRVTASYNDDVTVDAGNGPESERLMVSMTASASTLSANQLAEVLQQIAANMATWHTTNKVHVGGNPTALPVVTLT